MIKCFVSRPGMFVAIFLITVMVHSVSVNAAEISADMIHRSPMGSFKGKMFLKGDNLRTVPDALFNIPSGYQKMSMPIMPGMQGQ